MSILVTGATGLVGSAIVRELERNGENYQAISSSDLDLLDRKETLKYVERLKPTSIINAAARVGGIGFNKIWPVDVFGQNMQIEINVMDAARMNNVRNYILLSSSTVYPIGTNQPMIEDDLFSVGRLEPSNSSYAMVKIACMEYLKAHRQQYNCKWISVVANSLYGPNDNYSIENSRVFAALIRKFIEAVESNEPSVELWGSGNPIKDFLNVQDFAKGVILCLKKYDSHQPINIGSGFGISIKDLAEKIKLQTHYQGKILWDSTKPEALDRKVLDINRITKLGWTPLIDLDEGISQTISWFKDNKNKVNK